MSDLQWHWPPPDPGALMITTLDAHAAGCRVERVSFLNVPSFVYAPDLTIELAPDQHISVDIAFGGAFYAIVPAAAVGLLVAPEHAAQLVAAGEAIKRAVNAALPIQ